MLNERGKKKIPQKWSNTWCPENIVASATTAAVARAFLLYDKCCRVLAGGRWEIFENKNPATNSRDREVEPVLQWTQNFPACQVHENSIAAVGEAVRWRKSVTADFFYAFYAYG